VVTDGGGVAVGDNILFVSLYSQSKAYEK
jgi:hypothetical protein